MFYSLVGDKYVKIIPKNIEDYLTPLALAIWFQDDGSKSKKGVKIATNCFTYKESLYLCDILYKKYNLKVTVQSGGKNKGFTLYISSKSMTTFSKLVKPYMLPSLHYKLGDY
jgi:ubiquinol-cytochrome c reductase cytochrome b subunit